MRPEADKRAISRDLQPDTIWNRFMRKNPAILVIVLGPDASPTYKCAMHLVFLNYF